MKRLFIVMGAASFVCGCHAVESEAERVPLEEQSRATQNDTAACPAGALDTTFGGAGTGIARLSIKPDDAGGFFALDLAGSSVVAAGYGIGGLGGSTFKVARLRGGGTPDAGFAGGAVVKTRWGTSTHDYAFARAVGHQRDGRIVVIGGFEGVRRKDVALARYGSGGELDPTFGDGGKALLDLGGAESVEDGLVTPDDTILAAGDRDGRLLVARFTPSGALDASFAGGAGHFTASPGDSSRASAVALDDSGRILAAGSVSRRGQHDVLLIRLTSDGAPDPSFGDGGHVILGDPSVDERAVAVAVTKEGTIVIAGDAGDDQRRDFLVRRLRSDGSPDPHFGAGGAADAPITRGDDRAEGMAVLPDGKILVVGNASGAGVCGPVVARYTPAGELDPSFGGGGVVRLNLGEYGVAHTVRVDAAGRALIGGGDEGASPGPGTYAVVARMCM